jgi:hypothetical protein
LFRNWRSYKFHHAGGQQNPYFTLHLPAMQALVKKKIINHFYNSNLSYKDEREADPLHYRRLISRARRNREVEILKIGVNKESERRAKTDD